MSILLSYEPYNIDLTVYTFNTWHINMITLRFRKLLLDCKKYIYCYCERKISQEVKEKEEKSS